MAYDVNKIVNKLLSESNNFTISKNNEIIKDGQVIGKLTPQTINSSKMTGRVYSSGKTKEIWTGWSRKTGEVNFIKGGKKAVAEYIVRKYMTEAKKPSENKKLYKYLTHDRFVVPSIDREKYPNREKEGLEGPYRHRKSGKIYYYDRKEGKYYDPGSDMYDDVTSMTEHLSSNASIKDYIDDFVNSDNEKFAGKSRKKRIQMAIAAHYSKKGK